MIAEQSIAIQAANGGSSYKNYTTDNSIAQIVQKGATTSCQDIELYWKHLQLSKDEKERTKKFGIDLKTKEQPEEDLYQDTLLEEEVPGGLQRQNKLLPYLAKLQKRPIKLRKGMQTEFRHSLACIYRLEHTSRIEY